MVEDVFAQLWWLLMRCGRGFASVHLGSASSGFIQTNVEGRQVQGAYRAEVSGGGSDKDRTAQSGAAADDIPHHQQVEQYGCGDPVLQARPRVRVTHLALPSSIDMLVWALITGQSLIGGGAWGLGLDSGVAVHMRKKKLEGNHGGQGLLLTLAGV